MPNKKIEFKIPGTYVHAIFEKIENNNWTMTIFNPSNKKGSIVEENMKTNLARMMILKIMGQDFIDQCKERLI